MKEKIKENIGFNLRVHSVQAKETVTHLQMMDHYGWVVTNGLPIIPVNFVSFAFSD